MRKISLLLALLSILISAGTKAQDTPSGLVGLKAEAASTVDSMSKLTQEIVDMLFSFSELGFQEFETQRYLTDILVRNGFDV